MSYLSLFFYPHPLHWGPLLALAVPLCSDILLYTNPVMELHWDYNYYQPWTNNEWMVEEMIAIRDERDKDDAMDDMSVHQG